jgi:hypothetical protein
MKLVKFLFSLVLLFVMAASIATGDPIVMTTGITLCSGFIAGMYLPFSSFATLNAGVNVEVWKKFIIEAIRKNNEFLFFSKDDSPYVLNGSVVHLAQAGADPVVELNSTTYPGVAVRRTDTDVTYVLDTFRTVPTHVPWDEIQTLSYDKLTSVFGGHTATLSDAVADKMLINWSPVAGSRIVKTTGGNTAGVGGQTGTRKLMTEQDVRNLMYTMNIDKCPKGDRKLLIDDNMYGGFYDSLTATQMNAYQQLADNKNGIVGRIHGFDVYTRTSVLAYNNSDVVKAFGSSLAASDNLGSLAWHPTTVCRAFGDIKPFVNKGDALYYGDVQSSITRAGGRKERGDNIGVYSIVQAVGA